MVKIKRLLTVVSFIFLSLVALFGQENEKKDTIILSLPGKSWSFEINFHATKIIDSKFIKDVSSRMIYVGNSDNGLLMSVYLDKAPFKGTINDCREYYWKDLQKSPSKKVDVMLSALGDMLTIEYIIANSEGVEINQKNYFAFIVKDDVWIYIHLSKVKYEPEDQKLFEDVLRTVKIIDDYSPTSHDCFTYGNAYYNNRRYNEAVLFYNKALDQENRTPMLDKVSWRVLVDNLGMAYGILGDWVNAKRIFEYGIEDDPRYPMFYYNLACTYAENGDLDNAIINLRKAYKYRNNSNPGEYVPNPKMDSSFKGYFDNKRFISLMEEIRADSGGYSQKQLQWGIAACAIMTKINGFKLGVVGGLFPNSDNEKKAQELLSKWWGINSRKDVYETIGDLKSEGHRKRFKDSISYLKNKDPEEFERLLVKRDNYAEFVESLKFAQAYEDELGEKSLIGWDYCRIVFVVGQSFVAGYLNYSEAVQEMMSAAKVIQKSFKSWEDMGHNYSLGRYFWSTDIKKYWESEAALKWLLKDKGSPWRTIAWNLDLLNVKKRKSSYITLKYDMDPNLEIKVKKPLTSYIKGEK